MIACATSGASLRAPLFLLSALMLIVGLMLSASPAAAQERFSVKVTGEGPDVILIPGLATPRDVWEPTAAWLAASHRVHLIQVRGFGEPAGINAEGPVLAPLVEDLAAYIEREHLDHPVVVGHSMGGLAALMLAARHPGLTGQLVIADALPWFGVLAAPGQQVTMAMVEKQAAALRAGMIAIADEERTEEQLNAQVAGQALDPTNLPILRGYAARADLRVAGQLAYDDLTTDMREEIAHITAPVTVIAPWNTRYPTREQALPYYAAQYAALPGVKVVGIGPSGHFMMLDQPDQFHELLESLLAQ